jgi:hypothetical protein
LFYIMFAFFFTYNLRTSNYDFYWNIFSVLKYVNLNISQYLGKTLRRRSCTITSEVTLLTSKNLQKRSVKVIWMFDAVFRIRDILVWIRILILVSVPLTNGCGSNSFLQWLLGCKKKCYVFLSNLNKKCIYKWNLKGSNL